MAGWIGRKILLLGLLFPSAAPIISRRAGAENRPWRWQRSRQAAKSDDSAAGSQCEQSSDKHAAWAASWRPPAGSPLPLLEELAPALTATGVPRHMRSTEAARLAAEGRFTPDGLAKASQGLVWATQAADAGHRLFTTVKAGSRLHPRFPDRRGFGSALSGQRVVQTSPADFFARPQTDGHHRYHSARLDSLAPSLAGAINESSFALSEEVGAVPELQYSVLVRASTAGSWYQCHFDAKHNVFVQLHGRKRFYLWPTAALPSLRLHSSLHSLYRKSMIDMGASEADSAARFGAETGEIARLSDAVVIELSAGDVLYLPPMVPHHVECLGDGEGWCVGANVFSGGEISRELAVIQERLHTAPLGWVDPAWPQSQEVVLPLVQVVLWDLADAEGLDLGELVSALLRHAWEPLRAEGATLGTRASAAARFGRGLCAEPGTEQLHPQLLRAFGSEPALLRQIASNQHLRDLQRGLDAVRASFDAAGRAADGEVAVSVLTGEVVEAVVAAAVGLEHAWEFLAQCLAGNT